MKNREIKLHKVEQREFYRLNSLLGNDWAMFYILIGLGTVALGLLVALILVLVLK